MHLCDGSLAGLELEELSGALLRRVYQVHQKPLLRYLAVGCYQTPGRVLHVQSDNIFKGSD